MHDFALLPERTRLALAALEALLDGTRSLSDLCGAMLVRGFHADEVFVALAWLDDRGLLEDRPLGGLLDADEYRTFAGQIALFDAWAESTRLSTDKPRSGIEAQAALKGAHVVVVGEGDATTRLIRALEMIGVGTISAVSSGRHGVEEPDPSSVELRTDDDVDAPSVAGFALDAMLEAARPTITLIAYCADDHDSVVCNTINQFALKHQLSWIPYRRRKHAIDIGPLIVPRETACYECYDFRSRAIAEATLDVDEASPFIPSLRLSLSADLLCLEILKFVTGLVEPATYGRLWRLDLFSGLQELHPVLKLPRCPSCGVFRKRPPRELWRTTDDS